MKKKAAKKASTHLSGWDVLAMHQAEAAVLKSQNDVARLEYDLNNVRAMLAIAKLEHDYKIRVLCERISEQRDVSVKLQKEARTLASDLAEKHSISWSTHSYHPETGEIVASELGATTSEG